MIKKLLLLVAIGLILLAACKKSDQTKTYYLQSVKFTNDTVTLSIGGKSQLSITLNPTNAVDTQMVYSSADTSIATVGKYGLVTAKKGGNVKITVANIKNIVSAACIIKVLPAAAKLSILGQWLITEDTLRVYKNGVLDTTIVGDSSLGTYFQFNADNTGVIVYKANDPDSHDHFTYTEKDSVITMIHPAQTLDGFLQDPFVNVSSIQRKTGITMVLYSNSVETPDTEYRNVEHTYLTLIK